MTNRLTNYIKGRLKSFTYAFSGICTLFKEERNAQLYIAFAIIALLMSWWLQISPIEWIIVCSAIGLMFAMEAVNTAIEELSDFAYNQKIQHSIKKVKDLAAAAVLLTAIVALIAGLIIFIPKLLALSL